LIERICAARLGGPGRLAEVGQALIPSQGIRESGADVPGVDRARDCGIFCAFENGTAVGEDSHLIGIDAKTEQEFIMADIGDGGREPLLQRSQVQISAAFVDLDGIPAA
jgi:hypothetical protein